MKTKLLILVVSLFMAACQGQQPSINNQPSLTPTRTVGTGSGTLTVDGQALAIKPGEVIQITPGTYKSLAFSGLVGTATQPITLLASERVDVVGGELTLTDVAYLTLTGGATQKNLQLHDIAYRALTISGAIPNGLTLEGIQFRNVGDYAIYYANKAPYDGTPATALSGFKLLHCDFENAGTVMIEGSLDNSAGLVNTGFCKQPEVAYCTFKNSPSTGMLLHLGNTEACDIHHNVVDNVNTSNNNHNGIFFVKGNGAVHHNKCTNHQGNFVRFWPFSQGSEPKEVSLHDNIVWNSRKYSAFELQSFQTSIIAGVSTYCQARVFNNTVGKLNTTLPTVFVGVVVDVYNLFGGRVELINNLAFDLIKDPEKDGIWSQQGTTIPSLNSHNLYVSTASAAGLLDVAEFRLRSSSPAKATGLPQGASTTDYYDTKRGNPPSIGAVE